jgi:hypothetical protein
MGATRQNLQAQPKMLKKNSRNIKSTNQIKKCPNKSMFRTLKVQRSQKFVWENPKNPKKNDRNTKSINQNENFPKKLCLVP